MSSCWACFTSCFSRSVVRVEQAAADSHEEQEDQENVELLSNVIVIDPHKPEHTRVVDSILQRPLEDLAWIPKKAAESNKIYYYSHLTGESTWTPPYEYTTHPLEGKLLADLTQLTALSKLCQSLGLTLEICPDTGLDDANFGSLLTGQAPLLLPCIYYQYLLL